VKQVTDNRVVSDPAFPRIEPRDEGRIELVGDLTFETVGALLARGPDTVQAENGTVVDLAKVTRADSAGLALMVEWLRRARRRNARIEIINMPEQMRSIARMSKLDGVLLADGS
jgi:phospholipid transport system transporter-binding protein